MHAADFKWPKGFTLIELMIVVAIIGILATIAIPKFADLVRKSREGATKGNLGSIRSALSIYYGDMEGLYPSTTIGNDSLSALTINGKYLPVIPKASVSDYHSPSSWESDTNALFAFPCSTAWTSIGANDPFPPGGGWFYVADFGPCNGTVLVTCTHTDSKGTVWTNY